MVWQPVSLSLVSSSADWVIPAISSGAGMSQPDDFSMVFRGALSNSHKNRNLKLVTIEAVQMSELVANRIKQNLLKPAFAQRLHL